MFWRNKWKVLKTYHKDGDQYLVFFRTKGNGLVSFKTKRVNSLANCPYDFLKPEDVKRIEYELKSNKTEVCTFNTLPVMEPMMPPPSGGSGVK